MFSSLFYHDHCRSGSGSTARGDSGMRVYKEREWNRRAYHI